MPCPFASSGTVATSRSASRAILALNAASNFLRDLVISVLRRLRQSRTLHTLTFGPISGVHFSCRNCPGCEETTVTEAFVGDAAGELVRVQKPSRGCGGCRRQEPDDPLPEGTGAKLGPRPPAWRTCRGNRLHGHAPRWSH